MRPTPISDEEVPEGMRRMVIGPPRGDLELANPVEVVAGVDEDARPLIHIRYLVEDDDVRRIEAGDRVLWLTIWANHLHPFSLDMPPEDIVAVPECRNCGGPLTGQVDDPPEAFFHRRGGFVERCDRPEPKMVRRDGR